jgi:hypothetical protein
MMIGAILGSIILMAGVPAVELIVQKVTQNPNFDISQNVSILMVAIGALIGVYIGHRLALHIIVCLQGFISAYLMMRGISFELGGFPSESMLVRDVLGIHNEGEELNLDMTFIFYTSSMILLTMFSIKYQISAVYKMKVKRAADQPSDKPRDTFDF